MPKGGNTPVSAELVPFPGTLSPAEKVAALGMWAEIRLLPWLAVDGEEGANLAGYGEDRPAASVALKAFTYGHTFTVVVTNTQHVGADGVVANAWREADEPIIGFGLTREFEL